ncbi:MAG: hypothetical protein ACLQU2_03725 [Candidatus Binataceae bacterium]
MAGASAHRAFPAPPLPMAFAAPGAQYARGLRAERTGGPLRTARRDRATTTIAAAHCIESSGKTA